MAFADGLVIVCLTLNLASTDCISIRSTWWFSSP